MRRRAVSSSTVFTLQCLQAQRAGEQRLNTNCHVKTLQGFKHRPVDLWTTRGTELPISPTGFQYYDGRSQSNSTRNDEGPFFLARPGSCHYGRLVNSSVWSSNRAFWIRVKVSVPPEPELAGRAVNCEPALAITQSDRLPG